MQRRPLEVPVRKDEKMVFNSIKRDRGRQKKNLRKGQ